MSHRGKCWQGTCYPTTTIHAGFSFTCVTITSEAHQPQNHPFHLGKRQTSGHSLVSTVLNITRVGIDQFMFEILIDPSMPCGVYQKPETHNQRVLSRSLTPLYLSRRLHCSSCNHLSHAPSLSNVMKDCRLYFAGRSRANGRDIEQFSVVVWQRFGRSQQEYLTLFSCRA